MTHRASLKKQFNRDAVFPVRYGGEESAIIFSETAIAPAAVMAERLRVEVYRYFADRDLCITVSIGVSCICKPDVTTASELHYQADKALYKVKCGGKNRVGRNA
ncbi:response regulator [Candidatus Scalindua japonica]|uniref:diguanylate cyclase n=1 Tax=Candidatus Scalindua japonica TaxID=1284222 RepID=A0A286U309_9BACT|nr:diguanylate cyclase [Candidatus Scalindua japonica]GAX62516.1 response regulator [Candidatus Scalindua japonica]